MRRDRRQRVAGLDDVGLRAAVRGAARWRWRARATSFASVVGAGDPVDAEAARAAGRRARPPRASGPCSRRARRGSSRRARAGTAAPRRRARSRRATIGRLPKSGRPSRPNELRVRVVIDAGDRQVRARLGGLDRGARERADLPVDRPVVEAERAQRDLVARLLRARRGRAGPEERTDRERNPDDPPRTHGRAVEFARRRRDLPPRVPPGSALESPNLAPDVSRRPPVGMQGLRRRQPGRRRRLSTLSFRRPGTGHAPAGQRASL